MKSAAERLKERRQTQSEVAFDVYFNVIMTNLTYEGGWVPCVDFLLVLWRELQLNRWIVNRRLTTR